MPEPRSTQLILLSTLHQYHANVPAYSYVALHQLLEKIAPEVICLELCKDDLPRPQKPSKLEYEQSILPYAEAKGLELVCLEPDGLKAKTLANRTKKHIESLKGEDPIKLKSISQINKNIYDYLFHHWSSPQKVNDELTDALLEVKHNFQNDMLGDQEKKIWEDWNNQVLKSILEAWNKHSGKRILVLLGVERHYWMKKALSLQGIPVTPLEEFLG